MAFRTMVFRHVWRTLSDGCTDVRTLALQQWHAAEGWEHEDIVRNGGYWEDVEISTREEPTGPGSGL